MKLLIVPIVLALSGCASLKGQFENVLVLSLPGDRLFVNSTYFGGLFGITAEIREADAAEIRRLLGKKTQP